MQQGRLEQELVELSRQKALAKSRIGQLKSTYTALVSDLKNQIEKQEVFIQELGERLSVSFVDRILFEFGSSSITPKGKRILAKVGVVLKNVKDKGIRVVGHTDNIPIMKEYRDKFPSNWELSAARASSVVRYFQWKSGIEPEKMEAVGRALYEPVASNETEEGRAQNRRVEIIIAPELS